jgi:hypothetical protein
MASQMVGRLSSRAQIICRNLNSVGSFGLAIRPISLGHVMAGKHAYTQSIVNDFASGVNPVGTPGASR